MSNVRLTSRRGTSPSIDELAAACGVSTATVSRVFNRRPNVRDETRRLVLETARKMGYRPKVTAMRECAALVVEGYEEIGIHGYNALMMAALARGLFERGYRLEIVPAPEAPALREKFVAGVIGMVYRPDSVRALARAGLRAAVAMNERPRGVAAVVSDDAQGMDLAVGHLVEHGHRRIAYVGKPDDSYNSRQRSAGFAAAVKARGRAASTCPVDQAHGPLIERLSRIMRSKPTALVAIGEESGPAVGRALSVLGLAVPGDVSLVSFEQPSVSEYLAPPHTTIAQDFDALAARAIELMQDAARAPTRRSAPLVKVPYALLERESVRTIGDGRQ